MNQIRDALNNPQAAPDMAGPGDAAPERAQWERPPFPPGSPVQPLGIMSAPDGSQKCYYLDVNGQMVGLEAGNRHGKNSLIALFGPESDWLEEHFPQWSKPTRDKPSEIVGFNQADASRAMIEQCARRGIFDPAGRLRGRGAHRLGEHGLILHCGDTLLASELLVDGRVRGWKFHKPGLFQHHVYQAGAPIPRPWHEPPNAKAAETVLRLLNTWHWKRELLDARFVLGAIGASLIGGALRWRPNVWITGGKGTGKSTLNGMDGVIHRLFGDGLFRTGNSSAAGIRQSLLNSTVPVLFDEIEASADNRKANEVIELARVASSGDTMTRGSADHTAQEFTLRSCFWFSSINIPSLAPQDRSRLAILELRPFAPGAEPPDFSKHNFGDIGRQLLARMIAGWPRLEATKLAFHKALAGVGHDSRACDQFGILLACADVLIHDHDTPDKLPDDEELHHWASLCRPQRMAEVSEATSDHQACINHIVTSQVQAKGGDEREALATWIERALAYARTPLLEDSKGAAAGERLQQMGLKLVAAHHYPETRDMAGKVTPARWGAAALDKTPERPGFLAVAGEHQALAKLFDGTLWQKGVWKQSLARHDDAIEGVKVKFGKQGLRAVLVPLAAVFDADELDPCDRAEAVAEWKVSQEKGAAG